MDFQETLFNHIQDWTKKIPLIVLGSGASIPFGLPSMFSLGEYLKENINFADNNHKEQFEKFKEELDKTNNLEESISNANLCEEIHNEIVCKTWELIREKDIQAYYQLINNSLDFPLADFIKFLCKASNPSISILTTNYDRLAEYASCVNHLYIHTGFAQNYNGRFLQVKVNQRQYKNFNDSLKNIGYTGKINIWKVHGSIDWFRSKSKMDEINHMPINKQLLTTHIPEIITPGKEKYSKTHLEPYRTIIQNADEEITKATCYLCIGYGFNDIHIQEKLVHQVKNESKPIIVLTKNLTHNTKELIMNECSNYILMEQKEETKGTIIYSSFFDEAQIIDNKSYWDLKEYLNIIQ